MTVRLRAHHLLCMLTYVGRGYSPAFTKNYDGIVARLNAGEDVLLIEGPDDICRPLLDEEPQPHCLNARVRERDARAAGALSRWLGNEIATGQILHPDRELIERMRTAFARGKTRQACLGCEWLGLCSTIARQGYEGARLGTAPQD
ncbi:DUF1284 domain-containing protein [Nitratireductor rhodophyticola]|uniref:DUF1284 domain-containing protein n=1 Tax=Nitratireductor rhodophyticola TaxID=2854036 RepID=UPI002AC9287A|nr:DUF1284 domain-containing protein [Nitratireductor rhodophyticola]WPZ12880.1 DUF1284 domain-containing protein [Nitratireductor rhodophyticola]